MQNGNAEDLREFMLMFRQALLVIVTWIERRYNIMPRVVRETMRIEEIRKTE